MLVWAWTSAAQTTTLGTDFWVGFMPHDFCPHWVNDYGNLDHSYHLTLLVSSEFNTQGYVTAGGGYYRTFSVTGGQVTLVPIPWNYGLDTTQYGLRVHTDDPVQLFASNTLGIREDITEVLPVTALGADYVLQSCPNYYLVCADTYYNTNQFCIVPTSGSTTVYIQHHYPDAPIDTVLIASGHRYFFHDTISISGTHIWTAGCKTVAVFQGHERPLQDLNRHDGYYYEQAIPTRYWGRRFALIAPSDSAWHILRVTALEDSTVFTFDNQEHVLQAHETAVFDLAFDTVKARYIESNRPLCVMHYLDGSTHDSRYRLGAPASCVIHPLEALTTQTTVLENYFINNTNNWDNSYYLNLVVRKGTENHVFVDGVSLSADDFLPLPDNPDYSYTIKTLYGNNTDHSISTSGGAYLAQTYRLTRQTSNDYYHTLGASLNISTSNNTSNNTTSWLNNIPVSILDSSNNRFCIGDTLRFEALDFGVTEDHTHWTLSTGTTFEGSKVALAFDSAGAYQMHVAMEASFPCVGTVRHELTIPFFIMDTVHDRIDTIVCGSSFVWNSTTYSDTGTYEVTEVGSRHCLQQHLHLRQFIPRPEPSIEMHYECGDTQVQLTAIGEADHRRWGCLSADYDFGGSEEDEVIWVPAEGQYTFSLYLYSDLDSSCGATALFEKPDIIPFEATALAEPESVELSNPTVHLTDISMGSVARNWYQDEAFLGDSEAIDVVFPAEQDSSCIVLEAFDARECQDFDTVILRIRKETFWVPNTFTPDREENNRFIVKGEGIGDYEIYIFARTGLLVWKSFSIDDSWDGTHNGIPLPMGTYTYLIHYTYKRLPEVILSKAGTVTLLR